MRQAVVVLEELQRLGHGLIQHLRNIEPLPLDPQSRLVVAATAAHLAGHMHIGEKVHLHCAHPVPFAGLAAATLHIEREAPRAKAGDLGLRGHGVDLANEVECLGVGGWVRARRAANRLLVDVDHLVDGLDAFQRGKRPDRIEAAEQLAAQRRVQGSIDQRRLARA